MNYLNIILTSLVCHTCTGRDTKPMQAPHSFAYVLQAEGLGKRTQALDSLASCNRATLILDYSYDGSHGKRWKPDEIRRLRQSHTVLAYLSIGEAENYRFYWHHAWDATKSGKPDKDAPSFLCGENPDWGGNYRVKYWQKEWQSIILTYLDHIVQQGFDGVYLDIIDAFETFEFDSKNKTWIDHRINDETKRSYRTDMIHWVTTIASTARSQKPAFLIVPQNGIQLLASPAYVEMISGIGIESLLTEGNKRRKERDRNERLKLIRPLAETEKPLYIVDYSTDAALRNWVKQTIRLPNHALLFTNPELNSLGDAVIP